MMDKLLQHCGSQFSGLCVMDSGDHEKERGITITSKYTRLYYKDHALHVVDTPGHADFGGEVERVLSMVDGVVLLVDATEGPMSQTKFVLGKALQAGKRAIVVLNKIDREGHRATEVQNEIFDLFFALTEKEELLNYPIMYASGRKGWVTRDIKDIPGQEGVVPLLDTILEHIPAPTDKASLNDPFSLCVNTISADNHLGRIVTGKVESGTLRVGDRVKVLDLEGKQVQGETKVTKMFYLQGLQRVEVDVAHAGEIVSFSGCDGGVTHTVCSPEVTQSIKTPPISPAVISMTFGPNDSPLAGKEGSKLTSSMIKDRLYKEIENNVTLSLSPASDSESIDVNGRGELQIGILVETLRREGYEMTVSPPKVLGVRGEDGVMREPYEEVIVDIDPDLQGLVMDSMSTRKGVMLDFKDIGNRSRLVFHVPSRGMLGFRHELASATRGNATVNSMFLHYDKVNVADFLGLKKAKLVSMDTGKSTGYALSYVEERGTLFVGPQEDIYEGMVIGECAKPGGDMDVNPCKAKKLTNMRSTGAEEKVNLSPAKRMTVEEVISYMNDDEVLEVTPKSIRMRKRILNSDQRARYNKSVKNNQNN